MDVALFSPDYASARKRFRESAEACGCVMKSYPIGHDGPDGQPLTIDVAISVDGDPSRCLLLSSGIHGVEGYFGSAVQLGLLNEWKRNADARPRHRWVMIHAVNPYGMAWRRRVNEDNVDLNRNLLEGGESFAGRPDGYDRFHALLNPAKKVSVLEPLRLKFIAAILRHGLRRIQHVVSAGQYDYPKGIFFGGHQPTVSHRILAEHFESWLGEAQRVVHIDFHTGLGRRATYQMLVDHPVSKAQLDWLEKTFGKDVVRAMGPGSVSAVLRGSFGLWAHRRASGRDYRYAAAEFGTYGAIDVVTALRIENQCTQWHPPASAATERARARLLEVFSPASADWRRQVLERGTKIVCEAVAGLGA